MTTSKPFVAVVTGASSGIGQAVAVEFARRSAHVFVHARSNQQGIDETIAKIREARVHDDTLTVDSQENRTQSALCDITSFDAASAMIDQAFQWHGYVDVWVNAAGADVLTGSARNQSFSEKTAVSHGHRYVRNVPGK